MLRVAEWRVREVRRRDIRSMLRVVKPFGGISVASWSIIVPAIIQYVLVFNTKSL